MVGSGGDRLAAKWRDRRVEELYNATEIVDEIEITPVLRGSCRMQGPIEETDLDNQKNMVTPQAERKLGKRSMSRKNRTRAESGTCNVCAAPCSSCMHPNMGSKTGEFSDETCRETMASQYSINEGDVSKGRPCDSLQQAASEASNLLSVNSSHDSISANAESKATVRSCDISDTSEDFETHPKLSSGRVGAEDQLSSPKPECVLDQRIFSTKYDDSKGVEGHDDNISSVSRANDANTDVSHNDRNLDSKNISHSSASACSLGAEGSGKAPFSQKPDLSEIPSVKKVDAGDGFPKMQSSLTHSQSDKSLIGGSSEILTKIYPKSEAETEKDSGDPPDGTLKCLGQDEQEFKPSELAELRDTQPSSQAAASGDETDESDILEHDVKVCDICGDAGREDLLAICSRCSDGAEHTYCMREMLQKIPEGDWLCEECKFAEETENQKQGVDAEGKRANKLSANIQGSGKRQAENIEAAPLAKRQAIETSLGSPKASSPSKVAALSRDSSFKSLDKGKVRPASFGSHSGNDTSETIRSATPLLQTAKGALLKSNSFSTFNSKPKVKLVDEVVPQKQKGTREPLPLDMKEGLSKTMGKSMSFKSANFGRSITMDSKFKNVSPKISHVQDVKGLKQVKERNASERKNLLKSDRSLTGSAMTSSAATMLKVDQKLASRGETMSLSSAGNNRDSKVVKSEGKVSSLSKSNSSLSRKGSEVPVTPVGASPMNGISSPSVEQKPNLVSPKEEPSSSSSWTAERPSNNANDVLEDGLPRSLESTTQSEKPNVNRTRPTLSTGSKGVPCQKCKEMGHDVESCPISSPKVSGVDIPAGKTKGNKLKAAIEAAMSKLPVTYGKNRVNDQSDGLGIASVDLDCERASQDQLSVSNKMKNMVPVEATLEASTNFRNCSDSHKQTTNNVKQFNANSSDSVFPLKVEDPNSTALLRKAAMRDLPGHTLATPILAKMSAIPEHEYIWQGGFEVHGGGKFLDLCGGIQAHLSSCASPKVLEMVNKFPPKIHLNEVPRVSTWPSKFHESGVKEDNIALYFFAQDHGSYERHYKGLVDSMMKNDLALKGDLDGVELLIFPSSQLPENCQRWNMLFFLWGVFRVTKVNCSNTSKNSCSTSSNAVPLDRDVSNDDMSLSQNLLLPKHIDKDSSAYESSQNITPAFSGPDKICITINGNHDNKVSSDEPTSLSSRANSEQQDGPDSRFLSRTATTIVPLSQELRSTAPPEECKLPVCREETDLEPSHKTIRTSVGSSKGERTETLLGSSLVAGDVSSSKILYVGDEGSVGSEKMPEEMKSDRHQVDLERDLNEDVYIDTETALEKNLDFKGFNCQESNHQKRPHLDLTETVSQNSSGISQKMPWNEAFVDGESTSKKLKTGFSGTYGCSSSRDRDSFSDGFSSQIDDLGPSSSVEDKRCEELCEEKVIREDLGTTERYFFPVDSHVNDFRLGANSMPWKPLPSRDEDQFCDGFPNLELALGAETKPPNKGMLPFFVASLDKNNNQDKSPDKVTDKEKEEDVSASLSLSLSFPFPDKEQTTVKPVSKTEQLLPERRHVNTTPLLLFGGLLKK